MPARRRQTNTFVQTSAPIPMNTFVHSPLVGNTAAEATDNMISEGSPARDPYAGEFDVQSAIAPFPRWCLRDGELVAEFAFTTYMEGIEFVRHVADIAEGINHHPDIWIGWRKVRLSVSTHSQKAVTQLDVDFVSRVEALPALP